MSRSGSNDDREDYREDDPMIDYRQFEPPPLPLTDMHWTTESIQERDGWRITLDDALIDEFDRFQRQHVVDGAFLDAYRHGDHACRSWTSWPRACAGRPRPERASWC
jgi:hypothetical protein